MTNDEELTAFSARLNAVCDDMKVPPKGQARQTALAKIFSVSQNGARKWLEGEGYCSISMGKRIAAWANISFDWLMTGLGDKRTGGGDPFLMRYHAADRAPRILIHRALANPGQPVPEALSPSLRVMIDMVRAAIRNEIPPAADA